MPQQPMRAVIQRVTSATVDVGGERVASIGPGLLVLVGVADGDEEKDAHYIGSKILGTRLWPGPPPADPSGPPRPWAVALADDPGKSVLLVSQFTLLGSVRRGTKPDFGRAARPEPAAAMFDGLVDRVRVALSGGPGRVQTGVFGAMMQVSLVNDGPVTLTLDSRAVGPRKDN